MDDSKSVALNGLKAPFQLGSLILPHNVIYAPLAGVSDFPYRRMSRRYHSGLIYCEMVKMDALVRNDTGTFHILDFDASMHPIGAQICGSKPKLAGQAAKIIEDLGFDVVDLNCGCPVDKVTKDGGGSGLLKTPDLIGELISEMVARVKIPVTVKVRAGWDENSINCHEITKIAEAAGAKAICIHGRTRKQAYKGPANREWIRQCKEAAKEILVIGNGDLMEAHDASLMYQQTGCDAFLVARGTMGRPWISTEMVRHLSGMQVQQKTLEECRQALIEHFEETLSYHHKRKAVIDMRHVGCRYLKKAVGTRDFREKISRAQTVQEVRELIMGFELHEQLGSAEEEPSCDEC